MLAVASQAAIDKTTTTAYFSGGYSWPLIDQGYFKKLPTFLSEMRIIRNIWA